MADLNTRISDFLWKDLNEKHFTGKKDSFWESLVNAGTELWLDTGDMSEAEANWTAEMSALTTNNTLLMTSSPFRAILPASCMQLPINSANVPENATF